MSSSKRIEEIDDISILKEKIIKVDTLFALIGEKQSKISILETKQKDILQENTKLSSRNNELLNEIDRNMKEHGNIMERYQEKLFKKDEKCAKWKQTVTKLRRKHKHQYESYKKILSKYKQRFHKYQLQKNISDKKYSFHIYKLRKAVTLLRNNLKLLEVSVNNQENIPRVEKQNVANQPVNDLNQLNKNLQISPLVKDLKVDQLDKVPEIDELDVDVDIDQLIDEMITVPKLFDRFAESPVQMLSIQTQTTRSSVTRPVQTVIISLTTKDTQTEYEINPPTTSISIGIQCLLGAENSNGLESLLNKCVKSQETQTCIDQEIKSTQTFNLTDEISTQTLTTSCALGENGKITVKRAVEALKRSRASFTISNGMLVHYSKQPLSSNNESLITRNVFRRLKKYVDKCYSSSNPKKSWRNSNVLTETKQLERSRELMQLCRLGFASFSHNSDTESSGYDSRIYKPNRSFVEETSTRSVTPSGDSGVFSEVDVQSIRKNKKRKFAKGRNAPQEDRNLDDLLNEFIVLPEALSPLDDYDESHNDSLNNQNDDQVIPNSNKSENTCREESNLIKKEKDCQQLDEVDLQKNKKKYKAPVNRLALLRRKIKTCNQVNITKMVANNYDSGTNFTNSKRQTRCPQEATVTVIDPMHVDNLENSKEVRVLQGSTENNEFDEETSTKVIVEEQLSRKSGHNTKIGCDLHLCNTPLGDNDDEAHNESLNNQNSDYQAIHDNSNNPENTFREESNLIEKEKGCQELEEIDLQKSKKKYKAPVNRLILLKKKIKRCNQVNITKMVANNYDNGTNASNSKRQTHYPQKVKDKPTVINPMHVDNSEKAIDLEILQASTENIEVGEETSTKVIIQEETTRKIVHSTNIDCDLNLSDTLDPLLEATVMKSSIPQEFKRMRKRCISSTTNKTNDAVVPELNSSSPLTSPSIETNLVPNSTKTNQDHIETTPKKQVRNFNLRSKKASSPESEPEENIKSESNVKPRLSASHILNILDNIENSNLAPKTFEIPSELRRSPRIAACLTKPPLKTTQKRRISLNYKRNSQISTKEQISHVTNGLDNETLLKMQHIIQEHSYAKGNESASSVESERTSEKCGGNDFKESVVSKAFEETKNKITPENCGFNMILDAQETNGEAIIPEIEACRKLSFFQTEDLCTDVETTIQTLDKFSKEACIEDILASPKTEALKKLKETQQSNSTIADTNVMITRSGRIIRPLQREHKQETTPRTSTAEVPNIDIVNRGIKRRRISACNQSERNSTLKAVNSQDIVESKAKKSENLKVFKKQAVKDDNQGKKGSRTNQILQIMHGTNENAEKGLEKEDTILIPPIIPVQTTIKVDVKKQIIKQTQNQTLAKQKCDVQEFATDFESQQDDHGDTSSDEKNKTVFTYAQTKKMFDYIIWMRGNYKDCKSGVEQLKLMDEDILVRYISYYIRTDQSELDKLPNTEGTVEPLLTIPEKVMIGLLLRLEKETARSYFTLLIDTIEDHLLFSDQRNMDFTESTARFYTALCRMHHKKSKVRTFLADLLYLGIANKFDIIYTIITSWLNILPHYSEKDEDVGIVRVLVYICLVQKSSTDGKNETYIGVLKNLLQSYYKYPKDPESVDDLMMSLIESYICSGHSQVKASILVLSMHVTPDWTYDKILLIGELCAVSEEEDVIRNLLTLITLFKRKMPFSYKHKIDDFACELFSRLQKKSDNKYLLEIKELLFKDR